MDPSPAGHHWLRTLSLCPLPAPQDAFSPDKCPDKASCVNPGGPCVDDADCCAGALRQPGTLLLPSRLAADSLHAAVLARLSARPAASPSLHSSAAGKKAACVGYKPQVSPGKCQAEGVLNTLLPTGGATSGGAGTTTGRADTTQAGGDPAGGAGLGADGGSTDPLAG